MGTIKIVRRNRPPVNKPVVHNKPEPVKAAAEAALIRYYPDGGVIPASLPVSYVPAETNPPAGSILKDCANCKAYSNVTGVCAGYNALVRPTYVCATWKPVI